VCHARKRSDCWQDVCEGSDDIYLDSDIVDFSQVCEGSDGDYLDSDAVDSHMCVRVLTMIIWIVMSSPL
jgi:hypothetical protein